MGADMDGTVVLTPKKVGKEQKKKVEGGATRQRQPLDFYNLLHRLSTRTVHYLLWFICHVLVRARTEGAIAAEESDSSKSRRTSGIVSSLDSLESEAICIL